MLSSFLSTGPFCCSMRRTRSESMVSHSLFRLDLGQRIRAFLPSIFLSFVGRGWLDSVLEPAADCLRSRKDPSTNWLDSRMVTVGWLTTWMGAAADCLVSGLEAAAGWRDSDIVRGMLL